MMTSKSPRKNIKQPPKDKLALFKRLFTYSLLPFVKAQVPAFTSNKEFSGLMEFASLSSVK